MNLIDSLPTTPSILFVCTANQFRSPLAVASLLSSLDNDGEKSNWLIQSAGTWTTDGMPALLLTINNAERLGLDGVDRHVTRQVTGELLHQFDLIIVMEAGHKEALRAEFKPSSSRVYMLSEVVDGIQYDIPDPVNSTTNPEEVASELNSIIQKGAKKILDLARKIHSARKN